MENESNIFNNIYWQRKVAEANAAQKIAETELAIAMSTFKNAVPEGTNFSLSNDAKQALNNQTMLAYLKNVNDQLGNTDAYFAKQVFSGDDR